MLKPQITAGKTHLFFFSKIAYFDLASHAVFIRGLVSSSHKSDCAGSEALLDLASTAKAFVQFRFGVAFRGSLVAGN